MLISSWWIVFYATCKCIWRLHVLSLNWAQHSMLQSPLFTLHSVLSSSLSLSCLVASNCFIVDFNDVHYVIHLPMSMMMMVRWYDEHSECRMPQNYSPESRFSFEYQQWLFFFPGGDETERGTFWGQLCNEVNFVFCVFVYLFICCSCRCS